MPEFKRKWIEDLDERDQAEVYFAETYEDEFHHGTTGHLRLMLIAKLARMLDRFEDDAHG